MRENFIQIVKVSSKRNTILLRVIKFSVLYIMQIGPQCIIALNLSGGGLLKKFILREQLSHHVRATLAASSFGDRSKQYSSSV